LNKAWQSLEQGYAGLGADRPLPSREVVRERLRRPLWDRLLHVRNAFRLGASVEEVADITKVDPWFLHQVQALVDVEKRLEATTLEALDAGLMLEAKGHGFSDEQIAFLLDAAEDDVRRKREDAFGLRPTFRVVDTCAGEFEAQTPYFY